MRRDYYRGRLFISILVLICILGIGYAVLGANLQINGVANIPSSSWLIRFKANSINVTSGSVTIDTNNNEQAARIDDNNNVSYKVRLALPGDFYEFTVQVENTGSIDAMIDSVSSKLGNTEITTGTLPSYLDYSVAYSDGTPIAAKQILVGSGGTETIKVRIEFKTDIEANQLPQSSATLNLNFQINYVQRDNTAVAVPHPTDFSTDSWETIVRAAHNNNTSAYNVGDTKTIDMGVLGTHTLRVANNSTPAACETTGFSETACGFVLEFVDIISEHRMNPYTDGSTNGDGNKGGWQYSEMRTYVNNEIYNTLPTTLKNGIINTIVVSGHGQNDSSNFTTTDKIYLLSTHEVFEDVDGKTNEGLDYYDTAYNNTRQLDYYANNNVTTSNSSGIMKQYNNSNSWWWLRSSCDTHTYYFNSVYYSGWRNYDSYNTGGVSPAFRLG